MQIDWDGLLMVGETYHWLPESAKRFVKDKQDWESFLCPKNSRIARFAVENCGAILTVFG